MIYCLFLFCLFSHDKVSILCFFSYFFPLCFQRVHLHLFTKKCAFHFPKCLELFLRRVCHSNVTLCVLLRGSGQHRSSRLFCWPRYMVSATTLMRGVVTHGWPLGSGHPVLTCEPPGWPVWVDPTVTPHAVTLDWGCHACAELSCQVWQGFLQHACLLASFPVGLYSDWAPGSALDRLRETYQLQLHCFRDFI